MDSETLPPKINTDVCILLNLPLHVYMYVHTRFPAIIIIIKTHMILLDLFILATVFVISHE
jgi:hypothetical protein